METYIPLKDKVRRNVGLQTIIYTKDCNVPSVAVQHNLDTVEYSPLFAIPHSITLLILFCVFIFTYGDLSEGAPELMVKKGIIAIVLCMVTFGCIYLPDSVLRRPHPFFWRLVQSLSIIYLLFLVF